MTQYETGAKTHEVNNLILFIQNTKELLSIDPEETTPEQFIKTVLKQYKKEIRETPPTLTSDQKRDLINNI